ncbi:MAG: cation diffusion facilitator family transporter [Thermoanaerobaculia bacterium]|nr:cation diffusion facilitator family transporter [Thermoanaerobaculia bacterium]
MSPPAAQQASVAVRRAVLASVVTGVVVLLLKIAAYIVTGSVALLSDALESIVNVVAALAAAVAVRVSQRPADANHPFGHQKAEYFSAGLEGGLILLAALTILFEATRRFLEPAPARELGTGFALSLVATGLNLLLAIVLVRTGKRWRSPALVADGHHVGSDVVSSLAVVAGVGLAWGTGWWTIDPAVAVLAGGYILWLGGRTVRSSLTGLMDEAVTPDLAAALEEAIDGAMAPALEFHDLRTRRAGATTFVEFHLVVPGSLSVAAAHEICDRVEGAIAAVLEGAEISIHVEPEGEARHHGFRT